MWGWLANLQWFNLRVVPLVFNIQYVQHFKVNGLLTNPIAFRLPNNAVNLNDNCPCIYTHHMFKQVDISHLKTRRLYT